MRDDNDTDVEDEVRQFRDEADYAEEEYAEESLTLPPHDKFRLVERNEAAFFQIEGGKYSVKVELAQEDEVPESEWEFWPIDEDNE